MTRAGLLWRSQCGRGVVRSRCGRGVVRSRCGRGVVRSRMQWRCGTQWLKQSFASLTRFVRSRRLLDLPFRSRRTAGRHDRERCPESPRPLAPGRWSQSHVGHNRRERRPESPRPLAVALRDIRGALRTARAPNTGPQRRPRACGPRAGDPFQSRPDDWVAERVPVVCVAERILVVGVTERVPVVRVVGREVPR